MKSFLKRFDLRVIVSIVATISCVVIVSDFLIFRFTYQAQLEGTRNQLKTIARTAALLIDAERIAEIPLTKEGTHTPSYDYVDDQLKKIKVANPQIKYIYILKKVDSSDIWRFVVDADTEDAKGRYSYPGDRYDAGRFPGMIKGFNEPSSDDKIEKDEWGATLSGYAPIRNALGQPGAVLGVDIDARDVYAMYRHVLRMAGVILLAGIMLAIILGFFISSRVVGPVNELIDGTRYIADGNLHHRVQINGQDEISELANSFNSMAQSLEESRRQLLDYFYDTVKSLVLILELRDQYTLGHSQAVANYAEKIARRMGIDPKTVDMFKKVTLLHDIGKIGVRDSVLLKPDKLTEEEWESIKAHPVLGEQILKPILNDPQMLVIIRNHHERQDGKGYPDALARQEIPLLVAIVTVADSYDAMIANRPYRKAMSPLEAMEQLQKGKGSQFHPDVVDVFLSILNEGRGRLKD
jgi:putative nucleotidyltransferase with HDIG domain